MKQCPHFGWVFPPYFTQSRNSLIDAQGYVCQMILDLVKLTVLPIMIPNLSTWYHLSLPFVPLNSQQRNAVGFTC